MGEEFEQGTLLRWRLK